MGRDPDSLGLSWALWSETTTAEPTASLPTVAGRYRLLGKLGSGGAGDVFRALDLVEDRIVAVKRLRSGSHGHRARVRREVAALRLLELPGVVRILDDGEDEGTPFLVMELVDGLPFPGAPVSSWEELRGPSLALLETLARVHEAGVVHRDVKPSNVLVRADGSPVLLDFGLARGRPVGTTITGEGAIVGTPRYLAPEQLRGQRVGPAADLYAVGVMLYELLAGRPPLEADGVDALWQAKLAVDPVPLQRLAPTVPPAVCELVDALVSRDPLGRPRSAAAAVEALGGDGSLGDHLPWLGGHQVVEALVQAAREGRGLELVGPAGSGRSRTLHAVEQALVEERPVAWTVRASAPFESLGPVVGALEELAGRGEVRQLVREQVEAFLGEGVLLVDTVDELDRFSRALLRDLEGPVLRARSTAGSGPAVHLESLTMDQLRPLFWGPDRVLHLQQDGAEQLHHRTGGLPAEVASEVRAWVRAGLARWDQGRLRVERSGLDRLRGGQRIRPMGTRAEAEVAELDPQQRHLLTWIQLAGQHASLGLLSQVAERPSWQLELELEELRSLALVDDSGDSIQVRLSQDLALTWPGDLRREAHRRLARVLPLGAEGRLFHMLAGGHVQGLAEEALISARRLRAEGRVGEAEAQLREALRVLLREGRPVGALQAALVRTAVAAGTTAALDRARYELERDPDVEPRLVGLVQAAKQARTGQRQAALESSAALGRFADAELEFARQSTRMFAAQLDIETAESVLDDLRTWYGESQDPELGARIAGWAGLVHYRRGDYEQAARLHEESAGQRTEVLGVLSARLNAAMAWLEAGALERAEAAARAVLEGATEERAPAYEAKAEWVLRSAASSRGDALEPDLELVEAVEVLGDEGVLGLVLGTEAAVAWRAGRDMVAADLARRARTAHEHGGNRWGGLWARAIQVLVDPTVPADVEAMAVQAAACPVPGLGLDVLGALATSGRLGGDWRERARALPCSAPPAADGMVRGLLAPRVALAAVDEAAEFEEA